LISGVSGEGVRDLLRAAALAIHPPVDEDATSGDEPWRPK